MVWPKSACAKLLGAPVPWDSSKAPADATRSAAPCSSSLPACCSTAIALVSLPRITAPTLSYPHRPVEGITVPLLQRTYARGRDIAWAPEGIGCARKRQGDDRGQNPR